MALTRAKYARIRLLAAALETTTGVPVSLDATNATMKVFGPRMIPDDNQNDRELSASKGTEKSEPGMKTATLTFRTEVTGGATEPKWATVLLPACEWVKTSTTYYASNGTDTATFALYEDGLKKTLYGAKGTGIMHFPTGQIPYVDWTFTGKYADEADASILAPTFETALAPAFQGGSNTVTLGSFQPHCSEVTIDMGNQVVYRETPNDPHTDSTGVYAAAVPGRSPTATLDPEATAIATQDWGTIRAAKTESVLTINIGTVAASNRVTIKSDRFQVRQRPGDERNGLLITRLSGQLNGASNCLYITFPDS